MIARNNVTSLRTSFVACVVVQGTWRVTAPSGATPMPSLVAHRLRPTALPVPAPQAKASIPNTRVSWLSSAKAQVAQVAAEIQARCHGVPVARADHRWRTRTFLPGVVLKYGNLLASEAVKVLRADKVGIVLLSKAMVMAEPRDMAPLLRDTGRGNTQVIRLRVHTRRNRIIPVPTPNTTNNSNMLNRPLSELTLRLPPNPSIQPSRHSCLLTGFCFLFDGKLRQVYPMSTLTLQRLDEAVSIDNLTCTHPTDRT